MLVLIFSGCGKAPVASATPTIQPELIHNSLSFSLDPALGTDYESMIIAESTGADKAYFDIYPEYTELTIKNYPLSGAAQEPRIYLFPIGRFCELLPDLLPGRLADLQALIAGGDATSDELPLLPVINSSQMFVSQVKLITFQNGTGIRYITQYAQGIVPINNQEMFYTFQGLTSDGEHWVAVILPISNSLLPADGMNPPNGQSMEDFANNYRTYLTETATQLNAQSPDSFTPTIAGVDALVNSIVIQP